MIQFRSQRVVMRRIIAWTTVETWTKGTKSECEEIGTRLEKCSIVDPDAVVGLGERGTHHDGAGRRQPTACGEATDSNRTRVENSSGEEKTGRTHDVTGRAEKAMPKTSGESEEEESENSGCK